MKDGEIWVVERVVSKGSAPICYPDKKDADSTCAHLNGFKKVKFHVVRYVREKRELKRLKNGI